MNENKPIVDASGQWLNVGDVVTHANRSGSSIWLDVGYITKVHKASRTFLWVRVVEEWVDGEVSYHLSRETLIRRIDLCTKTGMTIERLKSKYGIKEQEVQLERPETEPLGTRFSVDHTSLQLEG